MLIILGAALAIMYGAGEHGARHTMSPTAVAITLLVAILIDLASLGPNNLRDKIAFCLATPAIREGLDGSRLDQMTVQRVHVWIQAGLDAPAIANSHLSRADVNLVIGAIVGMVWIYAMLCLLPSRWFVKKLGRAAALSFPTSRQWRLNPTMWVVAIVLGMFADLPGGAVGAACRGAIDLLISPITAGMAFLFGA